MFEVHKYQDSVVARARRVLAARRPNQGRDRWTDRLARQLGVAAVVLCCCTGHAVAEEVAAPAAAPAKIAVFAFELQDFSAAFDKGTSPNETASLAQATEAAKKQLLQSGRYSLIDTTGADLGAAKGQGLRNCGGCEAAIAMKLGADQALIGVVTKISMTEYNLQFQVSDARTGAVISRLATGLRMGADSSWFRGARWLVEERMLARQ